MKRLSVIVLFLMAGWLGATEPGDKAVHEELKKLEGTWEYIAQEVGGKKSPDNNFNGVTLTIKDDTYTIQVVGIVSDRGTIKVDPANTPKTIDKVSSKLKDVKYFGIYKFDGDTLYLCESIGERPEHRPKDFTTTKGTPEVLVTLRRKK
jgi:uncharacterized protein (TIGR03067 family)